MTDYYIFAEDALKDLFEDDSVTVEKTKEMLEKLRDEIDIMISTLSYDV